MNSATFFLPWPDRALSPNARGHWRKAEKARKAAKETAFYAVKEAGIGRISADMIRVRYSFFPPDRRARDTDNMIGSMKYSADGIALAIGIDDSKWAIEIAPRGPVEKNGMVKIELEWAA